MRLIGRFYEKLVLSSKYEFEFPIESIQINIQRLTNQLWKLIPMRENGEDWVKQLDTVTLETLGLHEIFLNAPQFLQLLMKLEGLKSIEDIGFDLYRKTVFESINLLQEIKRAARV